MGATMEFWSDKYVGKEWFTDTGECVGEKMCILFVLHVLKQEKGFEVMDDDKTDIAISPDAWYEEAPKRFVRRAMRYGKIIDDIKDLREFDVPFFKVKNGEEVRHCGVMIDKTRFIHQQRKDPAVVARITDTHWSKRFYLGIRGF